MMTSDDDDDDGHNNYNLYKINHMNMIKWTLQKYKWLKKEQVNVEWSVNISAAVLWILNLLPYE